MCYGICASREFRNWKKLTHFVATGKVENLQAYVNLNFQLVNHNLHVL